MLLKHPKDDSRKARLKSPACTDIKTSANSVRKISHHSRLDLDRVENSSIYLNSSQEEMQKPHQETDGRGRHQQTISPSIYDLSESKNCRPQSVFPEDTEESHEQGKGASFSIGLGSHNIFGGIHFGKNKREKDSSHTSPSNKSGSKPIKEDPLAYGSFTPDHLAYPNTPRSKGPNLTPRLEPANLRCDTPLSSETKHDRFESDSHHQDSILTDLTRRILSLGKNVPHVNPGGPDVTSTRDDLPPNTETHVHQALSPLPSPPITSSPYLSPSHQSSPHLSPPYPSSPQPSILYPSSPSVSSPYPSSPQPSILYPSSPSISSPYPTSPPPESSYFEPNSSLSSADDQSVHGARMKPRRTARFHDPKEEANILAKILSSEKTPPDTAPLISILPGHTHGQILELRSQYKLIVKTNRDNKPVNIAKHIKKRLKGQPGLMRACYTCALGQWESEGHWVSYWYQSQKKRKEFLIESIMGRTNMEIRLIKKNFRDKKYENNLIRCLQTELRDDKFKHAIMLALEEKRMEEPSDGLVDQQLIIADMEKLSKAVRSKRGGESSAIIEIIVTRCESHLRELLRVYHAAHGKNFAKEILRKSENAVVGFSLFLSDSFFRNVLELRLISCYFF